MDSGKPAAIAIRPDLSVILAEHRRWAASEGVEGTCAILRRENLTGADLQGAMLRGANLSGSRLRNAVLMDADLQGADLSGCDFQGADLSRADMRSSLLRDANFRDASLAGADLTDALSLLGGQLGGANLSGAKLPPSASGFEGLGNVAEASKTTQNLFATILLVCSYTWLTIASTTDSQLLNNAAPPSSRLPILGTDIPLVRFYLVAPVFLLCLYIYFHLCLQRLWEELAELPAVFPDGRPLDKKAYPWLMNVIVRAHLTRLKHDRSHLSRWQAGMSILLAWGLVPLTIVILWGRYLRSHEWLVTWTHVVILMAVIGAGVGFLLLAETTLRGSERRPFLWRKAWKDARGRSFGAAFGAAIFFAVLSYGSIEGLNPSDRVTLLSTPAFYSPRWFVPKILAVVGYDAFAQLDDASLSTKPANWTGTTAEIGAVKGADLENRNMRYSVAYNAFFVNSYLKGVDARGSDFRESDFRKADLRYADLRGANFRYAKLAEADLRETDLTETNMRDADLTKARLKWAKLTGSQFRDAIADQVDFTGAILSDANFEGAKLAGAIFAEADLRNANFAGAELKRDNLQASFISADLSGAKGLTQAQLETALVNSTTKLPHGLTMPASIATRQP